MALSLQTGSIHLKSIPSSSNAHSSFLPVQVHSSSKATLFGENLRVNSHRSAARPQAKNRGLVVIRSLFGLGVPEMVVIAGVAALVFGPKKLPELGKSLGKTVKSFQQAATEFQSELTVPSSETQEAKQETNPVESPGKKENSDVV